MKARILFVFAFCSILLGLLWAQVPTQAPQIKISNKVTAIDGKDYYVHTVEPGETLYSILKTYKVTSDELIRTSEGANIKAMEIIYIPVKQDVKSDKPIQRIGKTVPPPTATTKSQQTPQTPQPEIRNQKPNTPQQTTDYQVQPKETLYSLCKRFGISQEEMIKLNPELKNGLRAGMILKVPAQAVSEATSAPVPAKEEKSPIVVAPAVVAPTSQPEARNQKTEKPTQNIELQQTSQPETPNEQPKATPPQPEIPSAQAQSAPTTHNPQSSTPNVDARPRRQKDTIDIALMLPLYLKELGSIDEQLQLLAEKKGPAPKAFSFMPLYQGAMMAIEEHQSSELNARVHVLDVTEAPSDAVDVIQLTTVKNADLIVGPIFIKSFGQVAAFAKENNKIIVNPLSERDDVIAGNPYAVRISTSIEDQLVNTWNFIAKNYSKANYLVVYSEDPADKKQMDFLKSTLSKKSNLSEIVAATEYVSTKALSTINYKLVPNIPNIVVCLSSNEAAVTNLITQLRGLNSTYNIQLFGNGEMLDFDKIETEYLRKLNTRFFDDYFIDYNDPNVQKFVQAYFEKYKTDPVKYSFMAYDVMNYFLGLLEQYGDDFTNHIGDAPVKELHNTISLKKSGGNGWSNTAANIITIEENHYILEN